MKRYILLLVTLLLTIGTTLTAQDTRQILIQEAADAYQLKNYSKSITLYEQLLAEGDNANLYYNLANACFKSNQISVAILNYERALRLNPSDEDIQFNLAVAKSKLVDKIEPIEPFIMTRWIRDIRELYASDQWAVGSIVCFILLLACISIYIFGTRLWVRKTGFFTALLFLLFWGSTLSLSHSAKAMAQAKDQAILMSGTVTVKSAPDKSGTDLFVIHEGVKLQILSQIGEWSEIKIEDGNIGWVETQTFEII